MNASDVIGYVDTENGGPAVCDSCATADEARAWSPIFADSETDSPTHCERCEDLIPEALTGDGARYVADALIDGMRGDGRPCVLRQWWEEYGDVVAEYVGDFYAKAPATDAYSPQC